MVTLEYDAADSCQLSTAGLDILSFCRSLGRGDGAKPVVGETGEAASLPVLCLLPPGAHFAGHTARHHPRCLFLFRLGWLLFVCLPPGLFSGMGIPINADGEPRGLGQCTVS